VGYGISLSKITTVNNRRVSYFGLVDMKTKCQELDEWTRRRIRMCYWKNGRKSRPDTIIWLNLVLMTSMRGNIPIQEKATGESPIALYLL
jgi:hypothetical protein